MKAINVVGLTKTLLKKIIEGENIFSSRNLNKGNNILEREFKITKLHSYPLTITLGITEKCNTRCIFCERENNKNYSNMNYKLFKEIVDEIVPYANHINFTGWGENLIHPDYRRIFDYLVMHKKAGTNISVITNGSIMTEWHKKNFIEHVDNLVISINSCKEETYEFIMPPLNFNRVVNNLKEFAKIKRKMGRKTPRFRASLVAMKQNIEELPDYIEFAKEVGFSDVGVTYLVICSLKHFDYSLYFHQALANKMILKAKRIAEDIGIRFSAPPLFGVKQSVDVPAYRKINCNVPWTEVVIKSDGGIGPCCYWDGTSMGNLKEFSFKEIWNSERYRKLRATIGTPKAPMACKVCRLFNPVSINNISYHLQRAFEKTKECQKKLGELGLKDYRNLTSCNKGEANC